MTSEICVMNRMSVVLAADSASTTSYYEQGKSVQRYFKGANKVFQLSNKHPVGLMIYGNAAVMGVPWELVIKAFRRHLGDSSFDTVEGYAKAFEQYLNDSQQFFPDHIRETEFTESVLLETVISCGDFNDQSKADESFDESTHLANLKASIDELEFENGLDVEFLDELLVELPKVVLEQLRSSEDEITVEFLSDRSDERLLEILSLAISLKAKKPPSNSTGLVFAGFGDLSIYPETYIAKNTGFISKTLVMGNTSSIKINRGKDSFISGFAQSSMTDTFIIGFDEQVYATINQVQSQAFPEVLKPFVAALGATVEKTEHGVVLKDAQGNTVVDEQNFNVSLRDSLRAIGSEIMDESRQKHGEPLERVISMLPVEEMAELAATMVDLQSLKEKVTRPSETVGGPVDVAIITRNEGLVWKKRKHFFDANLNQRYLQRIRSQD